DHSKAQAKQLVKSLSDHLPRSLTTEILHAPQDNDLGVRRQRERITQLRQLLQPLTDPAARRLEELADYLVEKVIWIVGGDGWAYDIGYGGLDHILASGRNVNILVMDTEVYSNTGGQQSKSTPMGASAKFATAGKLRPKKDLGLIAMTYGNIYVASVAFGARDTQTVRALQDAASFDGVSLVIGYAHCIAHGYDMSAGLDRQKSAVKSGYWPLYRYDPRRLGTGSSPLELDAADPDLDLSEFMTNETRFRITERQDPERYRLMVAGANDEVRRRFDILKRMAEGSAAE
ncbi:MAG TPA: pyruvate:ferredoxin (flavodoxin) oxidoreductase, partial [Rhodospirillaceae bacterium]|nr:pyruvate:ferredoxin (flavodoxin) oxidoreductase [Rhodospirillaceae bacterium]